MGSLKRTINSNLTWITKILDIFEFNNGKWLVAQSEVYRYTELEINSNEFSKLRTAMAKIVCQKVVEN